MWHYHMTNNLINLILKRKKKENITYALDG